MTVRIRDWITKMYIKHPLSVISILLVAFAGLILLFLLGGDSHEGELKLPFSSRDLRYEDYRDVETKLKKVGFTNIESVPMGDLITGWLFDEGEVDEVSIDGDTEFSRNSWYDEDAIIQIRYHSFPAPAENEDEKSETESEHNNQSQVEDSETKKKEQQANANKTSKSNKTDKANKDSAEKKQAEIENKLKTFEGKSVTEMETYLTSIGYTAKYVADNTGDDFTEAIRTDEDTKNLFAVVSVSQIDHAKKSVNVRILGKDYIDAQNQQQIMDDALDQKLDRYVAWEAVVTYGKRQYPGGFKVHYIVSKIAEYASDENTWFLKALCDVTINGVKYKGLNCEARVTGTTDNPQVIYFQVY